MALAGACASAQAAPVYTRSTGGRPTDALARGHPRVVVVSGRVGSRNTSAPGVVAQFRKATPQPAVSGPLSAQAEVSEAATGGGMRMAGTANGLG